MCTKKKKNRGIFSCLLFDNYLPTYLPGNCLITQFLATALFAILGFGKGNIEMRLPTNDIMTFPLSFGDFEDAYKATMKGSIIIFGMVIVLRYQPCWYVDLPKRLKLVIFSANKVPPRILGKYVELSPIGRGICGRLPIGIR